MQRQKATYVIAEGQYKDLKTGMLNWAQQFSILLFLDSNAYPDKYGRYECLLAAGNDIEQLHSFEAIAEWHNKNQDWLFGHICYDYKNELEHKLRSRHQSKTGFQNLQFFCPQVVCYINKAGTELTIESAGQHPDEIYKSITASTTISNELPELQFSKRIEKQEYLDAVNTLRQHIIDGDCYEINYCCEGYCEDVSLEPLQAFKALNEISPAPFAAYYRNEEQYMMCASPERYILKAENRVLSQPIKGTARRDSDAAKDAEIKQALRQSIKDRAENVMIVDLVRNDLARSCETGSVQVDELFGIYSFPQVHQMISTVSGKLRPGAPFSEALRYSFPMGSMTGAPKIKVMELVDRYEASRRELFSGTVGYISPDGDFDFNVIIRSLFYNAETRYLSYQTGGAITYDSSPEQEWEEMRLKAWALERIFKK